MANFSASDVALTGFRIVRERPKAVAIWTGIQFFISLGFSLAMVGFAGPAMMNLNALNAAPSQDPAQALAALRQLGPFYLSLVVFSLIFYPVLYSTMNRAVLRPSEEGFGYIRLGADEFRQLGLFALILVIGFAAYLALIIAVVVIAVPISMMFGSGGAGSPGAYALVGLLVILLILGAICLWIWVAVRLSLASPLTFATRSVNLFGSWRLTRGMFWSMLGAYLVASILALIVSLLTIVISLAVAAVVGGGTGGLGSVFKPDMSSLAVYMTPGRVVTLAIGAVSSALVWPVLLTPAAAIYRSLPGSMAEIEAASAFD